MGDNRIILVAMRKILRPLVRILLRNGIPYGAFLDVLKPVYVEMAAREILDSGKEETNTRIATITGLSRKEVRNIKLRGGSDDNWAFERYNRAAKVVTGWVRDERFLDRQGQPAELEREGTPSFGELVATYSGDIPARTILDELQEAGVVSELDNGRVRLLKRSYIPSSLPSEALGILGRDVGGLIDTIGHNIYQQDEVALFQRKIYYDNIPRECLMEINALIEGAVRPFLDRMNEEMAARDRDSRPEIEGTGKTAAGVGVYFFQEPGYFEKSGE